MDIIKMMKRVEKYHKILGFPPHKDQEKEANDAILALYAEVAELQESYSWKPWKDSFKADRSNMLEELVDIFFFMCTFMEVWELDPMQFTIMFNEKMKENYDRIKRGYHTDTV